MSNLETAASELLKPMICDGKSATLDANEQELLSLWAIKTAMTLQFTRPVEQRCIPKAHFEYVYQRQKPPPKLRVWLSGYTGEPYNTLYASRCRWFSPVGMSLEPTPGRPPNGYTASLAIHHLPIQLLGYVLEGDFGANFRDGWTPYRRTIWPVYRPSVEWPPEKRWTTQRGLLNFCLNVFGEGPDPPNPTPQPTE